MLITYIGINCEEVVDQIDREPADAEQAHQQGDWKSGKECCAGHCYRACFQGSELVDVFDGGSREFADTVIHESTIISCFIMPYSQNYIRTININMNQQIEQQQTDLQIYEYILNKKDVEVDRWRSRAEVACLTHIVFKAIIIVIIYLKTLFESMVSDSVLKELMFLFTVLDFWFTKNYNGRKLLGLTWSFSEDPLGSERFKFQFRLNEEYRNRTNIRIFWLVQLLFITFPFLYFFVQGIQYYTDSQSLLEWLILSFIIVMGAVNLILFYKASTYAERKRRELKRRLPVNFTEKFGYNSLISYY